MSLPRLAWLAALAGVLTMALLWLTAGWPGQALAGPIGDGSGYARTRAWFHTTGFQEPSYDAATGRQFSWTAARARVVINELDRRRAYRMTLRITAARTPETPPPPPIAISVDGAPALTAQTTNEAADYTVDIPAGPPHRLVVAIDAGNTFVTPAPDQRTMGVVVESVRLQPVNASFRPTWTVLGFAGLSAALMVAGVGLCGVRGAWAAGAAAVVVIAHVWLLRLDGAFLESLPRDLLQLAVAIAIAGAVMAVARRLRPAGDDIAPWTAAACTLLAIAIKLAIFQHPQAQIGDAVFHVHRAQNVVAGNYFFTSITPKPFFEFPYAIALYISALPFWSWVAGDVEKVHLLRGLAVVADALVGFALFFPIRRLAGRWAGLGFAALYPVVPITAQALGAANLTNVFGQGAFGVAMALIGSLSAMTTPIWLASLGAAAMSVLAVALLSHFSTASVGAPLVGLSATLCGAFGGRPGRRVAAVTLAALVVAGAISYAIYYSHFRDVYAATYARVTAGEGRAESQSMAAPASVKFSRFRYDLGLNFGWPLLAAALGGAIVLVRRWPRDPVALVLLGWLGAWVIFAMLGLLTAIEMRANLAAAPLAAALAAIGLGVLAERWPRLAVASSVAIGMLGARALIFVVQGP